MMELKVLLPTEILIDQPVTKVIAEAENGSFCLLQKHIDFVSVLAPGILTFVDRDGSENFVGIGSAVLVKNGAQVRVSTVFGARGADLGYLRKEVAQRFESMTDRERVAQSVMAKLESDLLRRFAEIGTAHVQ